MKKRLLLVFIVLFTFIIVGCQKVDKDDFEAVAEIDYPENPNFDFMYDTGNLGTPENWTVMNTHDPAVIKDGDEYYVFSTDAARGYSGESFPDSLRGLQIRKSSDLISWRYVGQALDPLPAPAIEHTGERIFWAPDIVKVGDEYRLYYSASQFGRTISYIGLATSSNIEGPYVHKGEVMKTSGNTSEPNAIDPSIITDKDGKTWMTWGSFFGGIYILELNDEGLPKNPNDFGTKLAGGAHAAMEGPVIIYNEDEDYYYLFVSYGSLSRDYNVRVGRSKSITGPYLDGMGQDLANATRSNYISYGNMLMASHKFLKTDEYNREIGWMAPGHNSILKDGDDYYVVHHTRGELYDEHWFFLNIRKLLFANGWPVIVPNRYAGEEIQNVSSEQVANLYRIIIFNKGKASEYQTSKEVTLNKDMTIKGAYTGTWEMNAGGKITMTIDERTYEGYVLPGWNYESGKPCLQITAISADGIALWGNEG